MATDDTESCSGRAVDLSPVQARNRRHRVDVYNEVARRLRDREDARLPGFEDELWAHFRRLPARDALDVNAERAQNVLMHERLLQTAVDPAKRPAFDNAIVQRCKHRVRLHREGWSIIMGDTLPRATIRVVCGIFVWTLLEYTLLYFFLHIKTKS